MAREKSRFLQIRVSPEEKQRIEAQARLENFSSFSEFIRKIALDRCKDLPISKANKGK